MTTKPISTDIPWSNLAIPPGEFLAEEVAEHGLSLVDFAARTGIAFSQLEGIVAGLTPISPAAAAAFEADLGVPGYLWLQLDERYQATKARLA